MDVISATNSILIPSDGIPVWDAYLFKKNESALKFNAISATWSPIEWTEDRVYFLGHEKSVPIRRVNNGELELTVYESLDGTGATLKRLKDEIRSLYSHFEPNDDGGTIYTSPDYALRIEIIPQIPKGELSINEGTDYPLKFVFYNAFLSAIDNTSLSYQLQTDNPEINYALTFIYSNLEIELND